MVQKNEVNLRLMQTHQEKTRKIFIAHLFTAAFQSKVNRYKEGSE